jgi:hypothetical protein
MIIIIRMPPDVSIDGGGQVLVGAPLSSLQHVCEPVE